MSARGKRIRGWAIFFTILRPDTHIACAIAYGIQIKYFSGFCIFWMIK